MKVLFLTNLPSPYRVEFFNELAKFEDLTVLYQMKASGERNAKWVAEKKGFYETVFLDGRKTGVDSAFCPGVVKYLSNKKYDRIVICGVNSPTSVLAITWCKIFDVQYYIEIDGGFAKSGKGFKEKFKRFLISGAFGYFSTSNAGDEYLTFYGADKNRIHRYPFTSISRKDIAVDPSTEDEKNYHRSALGMLESKIVLTVGRFSHQNGYGKGYDILMHIAEDSDKDVGYYIIGDEPTEEFARWKADKHLDNVHFVGFKQKDDLQSYYRASDVFIFLSRGDVWGLVVNEAMANGLPVISSDKAIAGLEIVKDGYNGYVVQLDDIRNIENRLGSILNDDAMRESFSRNALDTVIRYTFENCSADHLKVLRGGAIAYRKFLRCEFGLFPYRKIVVGVGQFIPRKGFDKFIEVARSMPEDVLFLLVGGKPTEEYLSLAKGVSNVRFESFKDKAELFRIYQVADAMLIPTREDIWGLVINEALAKGVPVVSTDRCVAALELIRNGVNGYVVGVDDVESMANAITKVLEWSEFDRTGVSGSVSKYTLEDMAELHEDVFLNKQQR